jgi:5-methylcytosine-specific restriction endonuclease McrA
MGQCCSDDTPAAPAAAAPAVPVAAAAAAAAPAATVVPPKIDMTMAAVVPDSGPLDPLGPSVPSAKKPTSVVCDDFGKYVETLKPFKLEPASTKRYRKKAIPKTVKRLVWNTYVGETIGSTKCFCCKSKDIFQIEFHCGHVKPEVEGGNSTLDNLRPICAQCNLSMGSRNMREFMAEYGFRFE